MGIVRHCVETSKMILHTRELRRKLGSRVLFVLIVLFALGVFVIGDWLEQSLWLFTIFWTLVFLLTSFLILIAFYDALRVTTELTHEHNKEMAQNLRDIAQIIEEESKNKEGEAD